MRNRGKVSQRKPRRSTKTAGVNLTASRLHLCQVVVQLQAKPKTCAADNRLFETNGHLCGYRRFAVENTRQRRTGYPESLRAVRHVDAQLVEAIPDNVAGVVGIICMMLRSY